MANKLLFHLWRIVPWFGAGIHPCRFGVCAQGCSLTFLGGLPLPSCFAGRGSELQHPHLALELLGAFPCVAMATTQTCEEFLPAKSQQVWGTETGTCLLFPTCSLQGSNRHARTSGNKVIGFPKSLSSCQCPRVLWSILKVSKILFLLKSLCDWEDFRHRFLYSHVPVLDTSVLWQGKVVVYLLFLLQHLLWFPAEKK